MRAEKRPPLPLSQLTFIGLQVYRAFNTHNVVYVNKDLIYLPLVNRYGHEMIMPGKWYKDKV